MKNKVTAGDFAGDWRLARVIDDRRAGQAGVFDGTARFTPASGNLLTYTEEGKLRIGTAPAMTATRTYAWAFDADHVRVSFADGRAFHSFPHAGGAGQDHPCGADLYRVTYDFARWPDWQTCWTVIGPRKDYTMTSHYHRR